MRESTLCSCTLRQQEARQAWLCEYRPAPSSEQRVGRSSANGLRQLAAQPAGAAAERRDGCAVCINGACAAGARELGALHAGPSEILVWKVCRHSPETDLE